MFLLVNVPHNLTTVSKNWNSRGKVGDEFFGTLGLRRGRTACCAQSAARPILSLGSRHTGNHSSACGYGGQTNHN